MLAELPAELPEWPLATAQARYSAQHHGDYPRWARALADLPPMSNTHCEYDDTVTISGTVDATRLEACLAALHPWRKGPFQIGPLFLDTEWRSDWKWARLREALGPLCGRVLDIGCGNGYFGWRMLQAGAEEVIGIDPTLLFCMQHLALAHYADDPRNWVLPLKIEEIPATAGFDTVFSMGVIYHRREPLQHVQQLASLTLPGGRAVLESLVVHAEENLVPASRYARMRNVWCVPTPAQMCLWMEQAGFTDVSIIDISPTRIEEQRSTHWMRFESLEQALDPRDPNRTIEGHPAPVRAIVTGIRST